MQPREDALRRHFAQQPCAKCHYRQAPEALLVLVRRDRTWMVMATCGHCHHRGLYVITMPPKATRAADVSGAITKRDVIEMHGFLEGFNGDFRALFDGGAPGRFAAE
ncbi:MAG: hypothetical protein H0X24_10355 [Ktedonobacterales bacterium]|nr:hypothetical protein [Ktedonobacterales bacterium]